MAVILEIRCCNILVNVVLHLIAQYSRELT
jgi:hypothetical protein